MGSASSSAWCGRGWSDSLLKRAALAGALLLSAVVAVSAQAASEPPAGKAAVDKRKAGKPKYYFAVTDVKTDVAADEVTRKAAREVLEQDLAARPEFTSDLGATAPDLLPEELKRRHLKGFQVTLKLTGLVQEARPPRPGGRLQQLAVTATVRVFGTTIPEAKLAFGGDGEATVQAEIVERRQAEEAATLTREALVQAVHQAVDQAVAKLGQTASKPFNENKRKKRAR